MTVKFSQPFADWQSLFINMVPAHIARTVGWNTGFTGPTQTISGSWYEIQSYTNNQSVVLVRNPKYWGTPGKLNKIVFSFFTDDTQEVPALQNGEVQLINPSTVSTSIVQNAAQVPNTTRVIAPGLQFEHLDFNEADPYLAKLQVRQAIAYGTNRDQIISHTVGEVYPSTVPLGNRMFVPTQPQYVDNGSAVRHRQRPPRPSPCSRGSGTRWDPTGTSIPTTARRPTRTSPSPSSPPPAMPCAPRPSSSSRRT